MCESNLARDLAYWCPLTPPDRGTPGCKAPIGDVPVTPPLVAAQLVAHYLARSRYPASNECELRAGIHGVLLAHFQHVTWEACRTDHHRPEFSVAVGDTVVAVAVSLTGDCTAILRRSRRSPTWCDIDALVIASPRRLLSAGLLSEIRGKPILLATVGRAS